MPLRLRLALFGAAVVALTLVLFGALLYTLLAHGATTNQDDALRGRAREAVALLDNAPGIAAREPVAPADLRTSTDVFVEVFDPSWTAIYSTAQLNGSPPIPSARFRVTAAEVFGGYFGIEQGLRLFALPDAERAWCRRRSLQPQHRLHEQRRRDGMIYLRSPLGQKRTWRP